MNKGKYISCLNCQKEFYIIPFHFKLKKYCSKKCMNLYRKGKQNIKLSNTRKKLFAKNKLKIWNKGLTNKTDIRVKNNSINAGISRRGRIPWNKNLNKNINISLKIISEKQTGENNPNWQGGICFAPYDNNFNNEFKEKIKQRDSFTCQNCGWVPNTLCIHHIDYDKQNTCEENCISLCISCHGETSFNREIWKNYFQDMLNYKYDYNVGNTMITIVQDITLDKIEEMLK